ncbi:hypothetical protein M8C21_008830, partial [Ambrosia artemisiifolia]
RRPTSLVVVVYNSGGGRDEPSGVRFGKVTLKYIKSEKAAVMALLTSGKFTVLWVVVVKSLRFTIKGSKETTTTWSWTCWGI